MTKETLQAKSKFFYIQAAILSYYVKINQQKILEICFEGISSFAQRYIETGLNWHKPRHKFDVTDAKFKFEIQEDMDLLKYKDGKR